MNPLIILGLVGVGGYFLLKGSTTNVASAQQSANSTTAVLQAQAQAASASAQAFNAQAQALNLTQAQAQQAYDIGLSPQEYVDSGMATATTSGWYDPMSQSYYGGSAGGYG